MIKKKSRLKLGLLACMIVFFCVIASIEPVRAAPSTQSGSTIYISDRQNLTQVLTDIANSSALSNDGSGNCLLNANLINNNTANRFYMNNSDSLCYSSLRINSTNTSDTPTFWYYLTSGQTEINNFKITSWNTTSGTVESLPASTRARSAVYASGALSKMNISNSNLSYLGYNAANKFGVYYITSSGNVIINSSFLHNFRGLYLESSSGNNLTSNTGTSDYNIGIYLKSSNNNILTGNMGSSSGNVGIRVETSNYNNLTNNIGTSDVSSGILLFISSNSNNLTNNTGISISGVGIYLYSSSNNNTLTSNTGTSNTSIGIYLYSSSNNNLTSNTFNTNITTTTIGDLVIRDSYSNNTFIKTNYTKPRKTSLYDNVSQYNMSNDSVVYVSTQNIGTSLTTLTTNRTLLNWSQSNTSWSETWTTAKQIQYNVSGLLPSTDYQVYNGTNIDYNYTTDAFGVLTPFTINFTTTAKTVSIIQLPTSTIISWGNDYTGDNLIVFTVPKNTNVTFNVTADQTLANWMWTGATQINGTNSTNSYALHPFSSGGVYTVTVNGTNAYGTTQTITWTVTAGLTNLTLSGYVNNSLGANLKDALVTFNGGSMLTNSSGGYNFSGINDGDYPIVVQAIGYQDHSETLSVTGNSTANFTMHEKEDYTEQLIGLGFVGFAVVTSLRKRRQQRQSRDLNNKKGDNNSW